MINNLDPHSQNENDETTGIKYSNKSFSEEGETNKIFVLLNFMPQILPDDNIAEGINSLNLKQREVFNVIHEWVKGNVKYDWHNIEPIHIFLSGSRGTDKSCLVKVIYTVISKTLLYHCKDPKNGEFFYLDLQKYQW